MTGPASPADGPTDDGPPDDGPTDEERRRRRARVFGDVLPDSTSDDREDAGDRDGRSDASDDWFRREVPPHHG